MNKLVLLKASVVGFIFLISTSILMVCLHFMFPNDYTVCVYPPKKSNIKYYVATFFNGFMVHVLCELVGLNKWYCKK